MFKMWQVIVILAVVLHLTVQVQGKYGKYDNSKNDNVDASKVKTSKWIGISAWGLIFLILAFILFGVAAYYIAIFYPLLCKKERKYDRIELAAI